MLIAGRCMDCDAMREARQTLYPHAAPTHMYHISVSRTSSIDYNLYNIYGTLSGLSGMVSMCYFVALGRVMRGGRECFLLLLLLT